MQQCLSHILRHLQDVIDIDPDTQAWSIQAADALRLAIHAFNTARRNGTAIDPDEIAKARKEFDQAVACGISINTSRPWAKGNHPGLILARRLKRKADQVWLFTTRTDVPPTNNGSEAAIRGFKLAEKVSGCWRTLTTLRRHCRIRSYLVSARNHGRRPLDAIRDALNTHRLDATPKDHRNRSRCVTAQPATPDWLQLVTDAWRMRAPDEYGDLSDEVSGPNHGHS